MARPIDLEIGSPSASLAIGKQPTRQRPRPQPIDKHPMEVLLFVVQSPSPLNPRNVAALRPRQKASSILLHSYTHPFARLDMSLNDSLKLREKDHEVLGERLRKSVFGDASRRHLKNRFLTSKRDL